MRRRAPALAVLCCGYEPFDGGFVALYENAAPPMRLDAVHTSFGTGALTGADAGTQAFFTGVNAP